MPDESSSTPKKKLLPGYTVSLLLVFVVPFIALFKTIMKNVQKKPFFIAVGIVCLLGWSWSMLLSYYRWWEFPEDFIMGIRVLPYLPIEEFIIYPIGGAFSIFLYTYPTVKLKPRMIPLVHWIFVGGVSAVFLLLFILKRDTHPHYLTSQLVLYNGLCVLFAFWIARDVNVIGLLISGGGLGTVGCVWDYFAFKYNWWVYHAITNVKIAGIPVEDFNFYLMAPAAAVSLYLGLCRRFHLPQVPSNS